MSRFAVLAAALAALAGAPQATAQPADPEPGATLRTLAVVHARPRDDARAIVAGLRRAVAAGRLTRAEAARYRQILGRARAVLTLLPGSRYTALARVLALVRLQARGYNAPRALTLFGMLERNTTYLSTRGLPGHRTDVYGRDGVLYRSWAGHGLQFHPLGNAAALNAHLSSRRDRQAAALARALAARLVPRRRGAVLEYLFPYGSGSPPWTSGMAQAALAQGLAVAGARFGDASLREAARRAYRAIPGRLVFPVSTGPWIRLYSFSRLVVLNAQLQAALSLARYAEAAGDETAGALAARLRGSARALFGRFDTGYWSRYALGSEAPLEYHLYHIDLLGWLWTRTGEPFWRDARDRFDRYRREPPVFRPGRPGPTLYPWPADGFRDEARIAVWVSKVSTVTVQVAGYRSVFYAPSGGWYSVAWRPGRRAPGVYRPAVSAVDLAGNRGQARLGGITVDVDREPPALTARVVRRRLTWRAVDRATPWVRMSVALERAGRRRVVSLGRQPLTGSLTLPIPRGRWHAVLVASDSSGNRTRVDLGVVPAR